MKAKSDFDLYVSAAVRQARMAQDVSQSMLAFGIGVSDSFISQVESPKSPSKYNLNHINLIAKYLGCSPRLFLPEKPL
ncbi:helix-turn-helix domain-containing protein [uncultured Alistipes sp.]|uniref:helix-turn-helix domain-containing protein n=1 Tax=uncultured Alistipes sp. TaxID=538949 RepID=UPI00272ACFE0|nr:helix-turn-helix transcriptional regulator [uncultured Alistipes sp.]